MRRWLKRAAVGGAAILLIAAIGAGWAWHRVRASLPLLDGEIRVTGLSSAVTIERDALGVPTLRGDNRTDLARATGFLHAQDRFFQMDLLRRQAAGELAELMGPAVVDVDRGLRVHRFRDLASRMMRVIADRDRAVLGAYVDGVNTGLESLRSPPPEYLLLRSTPEPWLAEDTILVALTMYLGLQDASGARESAIGVAHDVLPNEMFDFLVTWGDEWDAPLVGSSLTTPAIPGPHVMDLRKGRDIRKAASRGDEATDLVGSNNWAVAGSRTASGAAMLANDMHLGHSLPNIWYRLSLGWPADDGREQRVTGVTLPGTPLVVTGSNGHVAWGFTNSYGDWNDLVVLEMLTSDEQTYRSPHGPERLVLHHETIAVRGQESVRLEVPWTIWGPIIDRDHRDRRRALRWVAHDVGSVNFGLIEMESARDVADALDVASRVAIPAQNVVVADAAGSIGWTVIGPMPERYGHDGRWPVSWGDGSRGWNGYRQPEDRPRIVNPPSGALWTANNRTVDLDTQRRIGDSGYDHGARARQIRDGLASLDHAVPQDLLAIQLDDRALFLERWRELLLEVLDRPTARDPRHDELRRRITDGWTGRASIDASGYRMVRTFRWFVADEVLGAITAACRQADPRFQTTRLSRIEGPLWRLVTERPEHLLAPGHESWEALLLTVADRVMDRFDDDDPSWGERNTVRLQHPLSRAVPALGRWLDLEPTRLPGDMSMPRVQSPRFGASERLVVAPGFEHEGLFHMPGGQSGHPWSPYYAAGHDAWVRGLPTPFLPGETVHRLLLTP